MSGSEESTSVSTTPILDSGVLPTPVRKKSVPGFVVGFLQGLGLGFVMVRAVEEELSGGLRPGLGLLAFVAALSLSVILHELGHLMAGWSLGFRFSSISVGVFSLRLERGRLKIRVRREMRALGYAAMHADGVRRLRHRTLIYTAAGPAANLISAAAVVLTNRVFPAWTHPGLAFFLGEFVMISILLCAASLVPLGSGSSNDGSRIAVLLWFRERARRRISMLAVGSQQRKGIRPKHWKQTWLRAASSLSDNSVDEFSGNWLAYTSANARKDAPRAATHLEKCLALAHLLRPSLRDLVAQEASVFTAWFRKDAPLSEKWVSQIKKPKLIEQLLRIRMNLALCCARRDFAGAGDIWHQGFTFIEKLPATLSRDRLRESWLEWQAEIQERQSEPATT